MKILIITNAYTPIISARAFRWSAIAEIWAQEGHQVDIVCGWQPGLARQSKIRGVNVYREGGGISERLRRKIEYSKTPISASEKKFINSLNRYTRPYLFAILFRILKRLHDVTWKKIYWPDYACIWFLCAFRRATHLISKNRYDALISVSIPFTCHLVGWRLQKKMSGISWLVDMGDPFCFMDTTPVNNHMLYKRLNYKAEKQVFRTANWITVTNHKTAEIYKNIFPESSRKIKVIPPLLNDRIMNRNKDFKLFDRHKINLSYIGNFYKRTREPNGFLLFIQSIHERSMHLKQKLLFHIFGDTGGFEEIFKKFNATFQNVILHGTVSKDTVLRVINDTDLLINIGNKTNFQIPSKIVEYAASGKPIINICSMDDDSSFLFLKDYPLIKNVFINSKYSSEKIDEISVFIKESVRHQIDIKSVNIFIQPFLSHKIAKQYFSFLFSGGGYSDTTADNAVGIKK